MKRYKLKDIIHLLNPYCLYTITNNYGFNKANLKVSDLEQYGDLTLIGIGINENNEVSEANISLAISNKE